MTESAGVLLNAALVNAYRALDTCRVANAIEALECRLRNEGFADATVRALFDDLPPVVGYAVTARIRSSTPPPVGHSYHDRTDWWNYIVSLPPPRIVVVEDVDDRPGTGAFIGGVHSNILKALGCVAYVTNGAVRDLPSVRRIGFQLFAHIVSVSHAFVHIVDFGQPVTIGGLEIRPGDVLHGDRHGLLNVPFQGIDELPAIAARMIAEEQQVIELCQSKDFSLERLRTAVRKLG
jgi:regulator of RNase E activity RraA